MKKLLSVIVSLGLVPGVVRAVTLEAALQETYISCVGIDEELSDLKNFVGEKALSNITGLNLKALIAAFSLHSNNDTLIIKHIMENEYLKNLIYHPELYIIGIEA